VYFLPNHPLAAQAYNGFLLKLSSGSKGLGNRIQELAARLTGEDPESVIIQDPRFSRLDWIPKKKTKRKERKRPPFLKW